MRLAKALAHRGVASRRASEKLVFEGRVCVNDELIELPQTLVSATDAITVDGRKVGGDVRDDPTADKRLYLAINKPKGYVCSMVAETAAQPVTTLLRDFQASWEAGAPLGAAKLRLFTVGRLDVNTTGLLLLTNDGDFANKVSHPSGGILKEYSVTAGYKLTRRQMDDVAAGTEVDGVHVTPVQVRQEDASQMVVTVSEGRNREVRVLCEAAGVRIKRLKRIAVGGLNMPQGLGFGAFRVLKVEDLRKMAGKAAPLKAKVWTPWDVERRIQRGERARRGRGDEDAKGTRHFRQARDRRKTKAEEGAGSGGSGARDDEGEREYEGGGAGGWLNAAAGGDAPRARVGRRNPRRQ